MVPDHQGCCASGIIADKLRCMKTRLKWGRCRGIVRFDVCIYKFNILKKFFGQGMKKIFLFVTVPNSCINFLQEWKDKIRKGLVPITVAIYHQFCKTFVRIKQFHNHSKSFSILVTEIYSSFLNA